MSVAASSSSTFHLANINHVYHESEHMIFSECHFPPGTMPRTAGAGAHAPIGQIHFYLVIPKEWTAFTDGSQIPTEVITGIFRAIQSEFFKAPLYRESEQGTYIIDGRTCIKIEGDEILPYLSLNFKAETTDPLVRESITTTINDPSVKDNMLKLFTKCKSVLEIKLTLRCLCLTFIFLI